mgnify:CR=1 FL=1
MASSFFKPVTSTISTRQEGSTFMDLNGSGLSYSLCDRTIGTDKNTNYFMSFNLPVTYSALSSGSTLALSHPEILQINVDKIVVLDKGQIIETDTPFNLLNNKNSKFYSMYHLSNTIEV